MQIEREHWTPCGECKRIDTKRVELLVTRPTSVALMVGIIDHSPLAKRRHCGAPQEQVRLTE